MIGAGLLGSAMAERLLAAGWRVTGYDPDAARMAGLRALGGEAAAGAADAAAAGDVVLLSLPDSGIGRTVIAEIQSRLEGRLVIDTTTGAPAEMEAMGRAAGRYVDATVAGSSEQARMGQVVVMAGGAPADYQEALPVLQAFASTLFHVGPVGAGARMKLVVNLVLGLNRAVLAEGLAFAQATGVDPVAALEVLRAGAAYSKAMDRKGPKMLARDWTVEARLRQHHKDVHLILAEAASHGFEAHLSRVHQALLTLAEAAGFADADNAAILEAYR